MISFSYPTHMEKGEKKHSYGTNSQTCFRLYNCCIERMIVQDNNYLLRIGGEHQGRRFSHPYLNSLDRRVRRRAPDHNYTGRLLDCKQTVVCKSILSFSMNYSRGEQAGRGVFLRAEIKRQNHTQPYNWLSNGLLVYLYFTTFGLSQHCFHLPQQH